MANFCQNILSISGPEEDLQDFIFLVNSEYVERMPFDEDCSSNFDFGKILECPAEKRLEMWGTKSNALSESPFHANKKNGYTSSFLTAWKPPISLVSYAAFKFPEITFDLDYLELGVGFYGRFIIKDDTIIRNSCKSLHEDDGEEE